jgi:hypothetical protein
MIEGSSPLGHHLAALDAVTLAFDWLRAPAFMLLTSFRFQMV